MFICRICSYTIDLSSSLWQVLLAKLQYILVSSRLTCFGLQSHDEWLFGKCPNKRCSIIDYCVYELNTLRTFRRFGARPGFSGQLSRCQRRLILNWIIKEEYSQGELQLGEVQIKGFVTVKLLTEIQSLIYIKVYIILHRYFNYPTVTVTGISLSNSFYISMNCYICVASPAYVLDA